MEQNSATQQAGAPEGYLSESQQQLLSQVSQGLLQQRRSVRAYEMLVAAATATADKRLLQTMQREERRHYYLLEGIYEELSGQPYRAAKVALSMPKHFHAMLQVMICDKLETIDFYEQLDQDLHCVKQRELLAIIISDQKEQARILATIYRRNGG